ncbi:hypothetical protein ACFTTN_13950 [Streptomyces niveus]|uniref:hypothetical protein n=1 Tax=Streptomyces niveus TaxID=193462 RepID=UPI003630F316
MSGCCGQGPVIVSGAAATPRLDVETVVLCDVLADGTVAGVALVEPIYDTNTGDRLSTRTVNPATGAAYTPVGTLQPCQPDGCNATTSALVLCDTAADGTATQFVRATTYDCEGELLGTLDRAFDSTAYTVTGTVGACPVAPDCESPTTPTATIGLCLPDGTPIAVTVVRDCQGVVTSEGWINLRTGTFSAGAPPVGTVACGDSQSVQVSGTFCDIDGAGEVVGLVLIEYSYAADGTIDSVRLVDATTGATYVPTGTITTCPAGTSQPEQDLVQLCDVAGDGASTAFVRDYRRDELGAITGHTDYLPDGTPYVPTGTVGVCHAECRNSSTVLVCDVPAASSTDIPTTIVDSNVAAIGQPQFQNHPGPYAPLWSGGTFAYPAGPGPAQQHLSATGQITADVSGCDGASGSLTISVRVRNNGPGAGQAWDGALRLFRGTTALATHNALEWAPSGWQGTLTVSTPITAADIAAGDIRVSLILETFHLGAKSWTADQFDVTLELEGCEVTSATQFLRTLVTDCVTGEVVTTTDTTLDGAPYTVVGEVGQCTPTEPGECRDCEQLALCDVVENVSTAFLRTVCRDCTGAVISTLDTELDGTSPYAVSGTVDRCCDDCETAAAQTLRLCDLNPDNAPNADGLVCAVPFLRHFVYDCTGTATTYDTEMDGVTAYTPVEAVDCGESAPSLREQVWNTVSVAQDPVNPLVFTYTVANSEDPAQTGTVKMTASKAYGGGCGGTATAPVWNGPVNFTFEPDAAVLALADVLRVDAIDWDDWEDKTVAPAPSRVESDLGHVLNGNRWHTLASNNTGHFYFDGPPTSVTMGNRNDGGGLACLAPAFGFITLVAGPPCGGVAELDHIVQPLCDTAPAGTTPFLRHWSVNNATGLLTALGDTTLDGTTGYAVTGTVSVCGQQADTPVLTGVRRVTGSTVIQTLKTEFPGLQSVSLSVLAGTVNVAMSSGTSQGIPAGASVTWSVNDNDDSSLAAASFAGASAAADYFLVWTYKGTAAG